VTASRTCVASIVGVAEYQRFWKDEMESGWMS